MKNIKKRLAIFLCLLMAAPVVLGCLPVNSLKAEAASVDVWWNGMPSTWDSETYSIKYAFQTEVGQCFNLGDLAGAYGSWDGSRYLSQIKGETYKSSDRSVASITAAGVVKVLKPGKTTFTVTYKGKTLTCEMTAVKAGGLGSGSSTCKALKKKANAVISAYGSGISAKNRYKLAQTVVAYQLSKDKVNSVQYRGFKCEKVKNDWGSYYTGTDKLVVPEMLHAYVLTNKYYDYAEKCNPVATVQSKVFKISSVSAKGGTRTVNINLKSAVTSSQIFGIKADESADRYIRDDGRGVFDVCLVDTSTGYRYYGQATVKTGSKKITLTMNYLTLKKGRIYRLEGVNWSLEKPYGWTGGKAFRAK